MNIINNEINNENNNFQNEEIFILNEIIQIIGKDYPYLKELLEYRRDGTLLFLKSYGGLAFYEGIFDLNVKKDVKDVNNWEDFKEFLNNYMRNYIRMDFKNIKMMRDMLNKIKRNIIT